MGGNGEILTDAGAHAFDVEAQGREVCEGGDGGAVGDGGVSGGENEVGSKHSRF